LNVAQLAQEITDEGLTFDLEERHPRLVPRLGGTPRDGEPSREVAFVLVKARRSEEREANASRSSDLFGRRP